LNLSLDHFIFILILLLLGFIFSGFA
jgi:hypothetical protein